MTRARLRCGRCEERREIEKTSAVSDEHSLRSIVFELLSIAQGARPADVAGYANGNLARSSLSWQVVI